MFFSVVDVIVVSNLELVELINTLPPFKWFQAIVQSVYAVVFKLCSYGSWSLQDCVCKSSCCQYHIILLGYWNVKNFIHFIGWWPRRSHSATQPLCQSGWRSYSATLPEWLEQPLGHSATPPEWPEQPLSHPVTLPEWLEQPLSHSVTQSGCVAEWLGWKFPPLRVQSMSCNTCTGRFPMQGSLDPPFRR